MNTLASDMSNKSAFSVKNLRGYLPWLLYAAAFVVAPFLFTSGYATAILNSLGVGIIFALSYNMLLGQGGMLSFGHAVYMGLAGFVSIHFLNWIGEGDWPLPVPLLPVIGALAGLFFGVLFGSFSTKRTGTIFAMISLGVAELVASSSFILRDFFGGEEGIYTDRMVGMEVFGLTMAQDTDVYIVIAFWTFVSTILMYLFTKTPLGRMANAVRDNPVRAEFLGYSARWVRFLLFSASGLFAGIAGALMAMNYEIMTAESVSLQASGSVLLMAYIGGIGHFMGPIIGALIITGLASVLGSHTEAWQLYIGLIFIIMVIFAPTGVAGLIVRHQPVWQSGMLSRLWLPYLKALIPGLVMLAGLVALIEINFHISLKEWAGPEMSLMGIEFNSHSPVVWAVAIGLLLVGGFFFYRAIKPIKETWDQIAVDLQKQGAQQ